MKKKSGRLAGIIIVLVGLAGISAIFLYLYLNRGEQNFSTNRQKAAERLYSDITEYDYKNRYPTDAAGVLELNNNINLMIYGGMLANNNLLESLVEKQRLLFSDTLLEAVSQKNQVSNLEKALEEYKQNKTVCYSITTSEIGQSPDDENVTVASVVWQTNNMGYITWEYQLIQNEDGQYKISRFQIKP